MLLEELSELADGETGADLVDTFELAVQWITIKSILRMFIYWILNIEYWKLINHARLHEEGWYEGGDYRQDKVRYLVNRFSFHNNHFLKILIYSMR